MKALIITALMIIITLLVNAQTFVKENRLWSNTFKGSDGWCPNKSYYIKFAGDTIINDYEYKKVWRCNDSLQNSWYTDGYIREDTLRRVYLRTDNWEYNLYDSVEILVYDFGLEVGDSVYASGIEDYVYVDSISEYVYNNTKDTSRMLYINNWISIIENIGSFGGTLFGFNMIGVLGGSWGLVCYFENDTLKYHNDNFLTCFPEGYVDEIQEIDKKEIILHPFISGNNLIFEFQEIPKYNSIIQIFSCLGSLVYEKQFSNCPFLKIPTNEFQKGIYIYRLEIDKNILSGKVVVP